jgi:putative sigma-54 modulation protein
MKISVQSIHFNADKKLLAFIQKKADKLDQFFDQIISAEVYLRLEKTEDELNKILEMKIHLPGSMLFSKQQCKSFEEAADLASECLRRQIDKYKAKSNLRISTYKSDLVANFVNV